ncbi:MAG: excinuclease ABC subunit UvrC, partial [Clostridia bacterium]|nr:excinuclease ABC subunit UvrC [Clostridia bacterium]
METIQEKLKLLPDNPGVYVMLDKDGVIIYVGKAKNLKNRVRQYFFNSVKSQKVMAMVSNVADFYYIIVPTEIDALSLENNLIKKHKPRYNILLKDDKTYPYVKVDLKEDYPTFTVTRKIKKDGAKYFGPYMGGINVKSILETLNLAFGVRPCDKKLNSDKPQKPCLNYHIGRCQSPCSFAISKEDYRQRVMDAISFLSGDIAQTEKLLFDKMIKAGENEEFELAIKYKETLQGLEKLKIKRLTALNKFVNADVLAYRANGIYSAINMLFIRNGRTLGSKNFAFESGALDGEDALNEFVLRYYNDGVEIPDEIILETPIADEGVLVDYFKQKGEKVPTFINPKQGVRKQLADMAGVNAEEHLETNVDKIKHKDDMTVSAYKTLQERLSLKRFPRRMECYDISNVSGVDKVGSMVVFINGEADKSSYRRFKIKSFEGADDYRSHQEMMERRLERLFTDPEKFPKPDLIIIDGGKGQLSAVKEVFDKKGINDI